MMFFGVFIFIASFLLPRHSAFKSTFVPTDLCLNFASKQPMALPLVTDDVLVYNSLTTLENGLCEDFLACAKTEIIKKNAFFAAIPGGSVLKLLKGLTSRLNEVDWSKVFIYYVNHKCVPNDDPSATHYKAKNYFLDATKIPRNNIATLAGSDVVETKGHDTDAHLYIQKIKDVLPQNEGLPIFDYMLLGMGKDGHIGSLYPGRKEVLNKESWVLPVDKKSPASITLSLPVINAAKNIRVVFSGADKNEAALHAVSRSKSPSEFPVCGVQNALWMGDESACQMLMKSKIANFIIKA